MVHLALFVGQAVLSSAAGRSVPCVWRALLRSLSAACTVIRRDGRSWSGHIGIGRVLGHVCCGPLRGPDSRSCCDTAIRVWIPLCATRLMCVRCRGSQRLLLVAVNTSIDGANRQ